MIFSLNRIILFVHDVDSQKQFYQTVFGFDIIEEIAGEWVVLKTGVAELALHKIGQAYTDVNTSKGQTNLKLVFETEGDIDDLREELIGKNVVMGNVKHFDKHYLLCDGADPEGNVFQLKVKRTDKPNLWH